jgi:hypothetical protein
MAVLTEAPKATVVALKTKRKASKAGKRRDALARAIVALWSGFAMLSTILLLGTLGTLALRNGLLGIGIALGILCLAGWAIAGRLVHKKPEMAAQADVRSFGRGSR